MPKEDYEPVRTASGGVWPPVEEERGAAASSSGVPRWAAPPAPAPPSAPLAIFSADGDDDPLEQPLVSGAEEPPPPPSPPWFCLLAFFVCSCLFLLEIRTNGWEFQPFVCPYECEGTSAGNGTRWLFPCYEDGTRCEGNPLLGPKAEVMDQLGAKNDEAMFVRHEWWRVLSCNWLHAGLIHLGFNMLGLKNLGVPLERRFGFKRTALLYVVSGLFGTMVSVIFLPGTISVGASASVFGLLGAVWADVIQNQCTRCDVHLGGLACLAVMTVLNFCLGLTPMIDNFMHTGGLTSGLLIGVAALPKKHETRPCWGLFGAGGSMRRTLFQRGLRTLAALSMLGLVGVVMTAAIWNDAMAFFRSCEWCSSLNCLEISLFTDKPWWSCCVAQAGAPFEAACDLTQSFCTYDPAEPSSVQAMCLELCQHC